MRFLLVLIFIIITQTIQTGVYANKAGQLPGNVFLPAESISIKDKEFPSLKKVVFTRKLKNYNSFLLLYTNLAGSNEIIDNETKPGIWQRFIDTYRSSPLKVKTLIVILIYLLFSLLVLFIAILINRQIQTKKRRKQKELRIEFQEQLADFLFNDEVEHIEFRGIDKIENRQILIDELRQLHSNLYGETSSKLRDLYFNLNLHRDSLRKVYHRRWDQKAKGFREVAQMDVKDANDYIVGFVNAKSPIIRVEAQVAMVKLSENAPLAFLDNMKYPLSEWEQINIYDTLIYHQINIDSFEPWLDNENHSVVVFALRMIALFKHLHSAPRVKELLFHENPEVKLAAVQTLKPLEISEYIPELKQLYLEETHNLIYFLDQHRENENQKEIKSLGDLTIRKIRFEIIDTLQMIATANEVPFLTEAAKEPENSFKLRMLAVKILYSIKPEGQNQLSRMFDDADIQLKDMIINVLQNTES